MEAWAGSFDQPCAMRRDSGGSWEEANQALVLDLNGNAASLSRRISKSVGLRSLNQASCHRGMTIHPSMGPAARSRRSDSSLLFAP